jgi:hypothetical protein
MTEAYIATLAAVQEWAASGQPDAIDFLERAARCAAPLFGVDEGEIHAWFATQAKADAWLAEMNENAA